MVPARLSSPPECASPWEAHIVIVGKTRPAEEGHPSFAGAEPADVVSAHQSLEVTAWRACRVLGAAQTPRQPDSGRLCMPAAVLFSCLEGKAVD